MDKLESDQKDYDDIWDGFDFKPLSDGLGFHQAKNDVPQLFDNVKSMKASPKLQPNYHPYSQAKLENNLIGSLPFQKDLVQNDLALFYSSHVQNINLDQKLSIDEDLKNLDVSVKHASYSQRFVAFIIDLLIISFTCFVTFSAISFITNIPFWTDFILLDQLILTIFGIFFISYYIIYFTLLEKFHGKSLGKDLIGIKIVSKKNPTIITFFLRSILTLLGFLSLGITNFFNLPGKLSQTYIIKD